VIQYLFQHLEKQEKGSFCCIDLWNEDTEAQKEEAENKECKDDESVVSDNKENVNKEENKRQKSF